MLLRIKAKPGSKTDEIIEEPDGTVKVKIKAQPIEGKANKYLTAFLADVLELPKSKIVLLKGETNQFKTFEIDADEATVMNKLLGK